MNPPALRGTCPDAETSERITLIKAVTLLRATYQVRLLALKAAETGKILVLKVPAACNFDSSLNRLIRSAPGLIQRENL